MCNECDLSRVGQNRIYQNHTYIRCIYGIFGREITKYTVIYGVYIQYWPNLRIYTPLYMTVYLVFSLPAIPYVHRVGQNHTYIRCIYGIFSREITIHTVIYGADIRFWPNLRIYTPLYMTVYLVNSLPAIPYVHRVGQNHTYIRCIYGIFSREITIHTVIYGADTRFWPTLHVRTVLASPRYIVMDVCRHDRAAGEH